MASSEALEALFVGNPDFEEIEKSLDVFCPFEAIGMVRQEIRHAHFLAHCLDPQRPHGFGSECLRALMRSAAVAYRRVDEGVEGQITPLDVHVMDLEQSQVRREWRSIDLLVVVKEEKLVVAIELKIDASEHSGQLKRYRETVSQEWPVADGWRHLFLFLTKAGDEASEEAGQDWLALDLEAVAAELDGVVEKQTGSAEARALLASYLAMLRRHHLTNERLKEVAEKLWSQHREALEFLMEHKPDQNDGVFGSLHSQRQELAEMMSEASGLRIVLDDCSPSIIRFAVTDWDRMMNFRTAVKWTTSNRAMLVEVQPSNDKKTIRIRVVLGPADHSLRQTFYEELASKGVRLSNRRAITQNYTRLATETVAQGLDDDNKDVEATVAQAIEAIKRYAADTLTAYDKALVSLKEMDIFGDFDRDQK
ncbi:PD-(D/E)XK nuclease family protein [Sphingobium lactosutens]|uniref:PD-(D/E)XK nuclease superfamily protein n=1 Tax=Sphingobium lactosutens DS20 TaxID=1331060 RepID=T0H4F5_9SPHN|nr:PD-(D/E)XK nuclease family protein [Sphingobium lactosutens]EQB11241.1 hypothetical protein RLDS_22835 [Sphingobium lactosutens DS20]